MALSSLLLAGNKSSIDKELDSLFKTNVKVSRPQPTHNNTTVSTNTSTLKRKNDFDDIQDADSPSKRVKGGASTTKKEKKAIVPESNKKAKASGKQKRNVRDSEGTGSEGDEVHDVGSDDEDNSDLENAYLERTVAGNKGKQKPQKEEDEEEDEDEEVIEDGDSESDPDALPPQHESLSSSSERKKQKQKSAPKIKYIPAYETPEQRNARTIFVGNLAVEIAQKKPLRKQLQRHILSLIPTTTAGPKPKVESIRFRSVPFAAPTDTLPEDEVKSKAKGKAMKKKELSRQHDLDRSSNWREKEKNADGETEKKFLTPAQKKKVAFITQDFHSSANNMHAYIVFAHPPPVDKAPSSSDANHKSKLPPPLGVMDPYEAARLAKETCDGTMFMDRALRVDVAAKNALAATVNTEGRVVKTDVDPKKCVFVGNLDFESREEDLRVFFEGVVSSEKGPRSTGSAEEDDSEVEDDGQTRAQPKNWVKRVRIIRDKDTQLGKGFGYIQFVNHECVDEILALEPSKLKFAKRKLRMERCKTLPGVSMTLSSKPNSSKASSRPTPAVVPKGDPSLGEKLAHLSKEDRKQAKATDPERLARRLAKKKARMALATPGKGSEGIKMAGKNDRSRERKTGAAKGQGKHGIGSATKGRVRSEKSAGKRNLKK